MARITLILSLITAVVALLGGFQWALTEWRNWRARRRLLLLLMVVSYGGMASPVGAVTLYYLDPDWGGTQSGTQAQPFASFSAGNWTTINTALASGDVTVYLSARDAGSDVDDQLAANISIDGNKTANPTGTLTLDGVSFYNTNDGTPSWAAYSGTSKARVLGVLSRNSAHTKYSKVTLNGLHILQTTVNKAVSICGDTWIIQNSEIEHTAGSEDPMILLVPTSDSAHEGSADYCVAMSGITIQNNVLHDSNGEMIYMGGVGCAVNDADLVAPNCQGYPAHSNINILNNTMFNCGSNGGQGDCIDMKAGLSNVTIRGNDISATSGTDTRAIVSQGTITAGSPNQQVIIERNYIHDTGTLEDGMIAFASSWGTPNGITIRNNILDTGGNAGDSGVLIYDSQAANGVFIYSNTIYNLAGLCIRVDAGTTTIRNNACLSNNGGGAQTSLSGTITQSNNAYGGSWGGTCTNCVSGLTSGAFTNVAGGDFTLTSGSALKNVGFTVASFSDDYLGTTRPQGASWDIGAYEYAVASPSIGLRSVVSIRMMQLLEVLVPVIGLGWHFRRALLTGVLVSVTWSAITVALLQETAQATLRTATTRLAITYLDWTNRKPQ